MDTIRNFDVNRTLRLGLNADGLPGLAIFDGLKLKRPSMKQHSIHHEKI